MSRKTQKMAVPIVHFLESASVTCLTADRKQRVNMDDGTDSVIMNWKLPQKMLQTIEVDNTIS